MYVYENNYQNKQKCNWAVSAWTQRLLQEPRTQVRILSWLHKVLLVATVCQRLYTYKQRYIHTYVHAYIYRYIHMLCSGSVPSCSKKQDDGNWEKGW
jgi:hypothetical protein